MRRQSRYNNRGQFDFVWIFAIVVGIGILLLAIYGANKFGDTEKYASDTAVAKKLEILTNPLEAGFSEGKYGTITFSQETKIDNLCLAGGLGTQEISVSTRSSGDEWGSPSDAVSVANKYIFSEDEISGKTFYVFSKPFEFPYEIADILFVTTDTYCFVSAPDEIYDEVEGLGIPNIELDNCSESSIKVCFGTSSGCNVAVYGSCTDSCTSVYQEGTVVKSNSQVKYVGSLLYAAIFADADNYECNVRRLMYRTSKIAEIFLGKAELMDARGCDTNLVSALSYWNSVTANSSSEDLGVNSQTAKVLDKQNEGELCGLW